MDSLGEARGLATPDVQRALDWLLDLGFNVVDTLGNPRGSGFSVRLVGPGPAVSITRDKNQWMCSIMDVEGEWLPIDVFVMAMGVRLPDADERRRPLPDQLPTGVSWAEQLPRIFEWLAIEDRTALLDEATTAWRYGTRR